MPFKLLPTLALLLSTAGCAVSPYQNRTLLNENGDQKRYFFAYGKFCGPEYPALRGSQSLIDFWPPADDLDAICYAHDQCYTLTFGDNDLCDGALHEMVIDFSNKFKNEGCWNLSTDFIIVFFGKNYGKSNTATGTAATRLVQTTLGLPTAVFWAALKTPLRPFLSAPREGSCNIEEKSNPIPMIQAFEMRYLKSILNRTKTQVSIPIQQ